jgi:ABC-2 type transport system ATP-binding protein
MADLLQVRNLSKSYTSHQALNDISLCIPEGAIVGLLGPNGAGKTSLIRIITGITNHDEGEIIFNGESLQSKHQMSVGYLPEERGLYKKMKVSEQLIYLARLKGIDKKEAVDITDEWITKFSLDKWKNHYVADLSKGMQQKVQFIAAVSHNPKLLILDEPFSGLDPVNADFLKNQILDLNSKGTTIMLSTHRMENVEELCEDVVMVNASKIVIQGSVPSLRKKFAEGKVKLLLKTDSEFSEEVVNKMDEGVYEVILDQSKYESMNTLIAEMMKKGEVLNVEILEPTMRDIFLKQVAIE